MKTSVSPGFKYFLVAMALFAFMMMSIRCAHAAEDNTLRWTAPTQYANGEALPPEEIKGYQVNITWNGVAQPGKTAPGGTTVSWVDRVNNPGLWCYTLQTISIDDQVSAPSNQACKQVTNGNPNPPRDVTVN